MEQGENTSTMMGRKASPAKEEWVCVDTHVQCQKRNGNGLCGRHVASPEMLSGKKRCPAISQPNTSGC